MPDLGDLITGTAHIEIPTRGAPLLIDYRPGDLTPRQTALARRYGSAQFEDLSPDEQTNAEQQVARALLALIDRWNLSRNGVLVPLTLEGLQDVTFAQQAMILQALTSAQTPKSAPQAQEGNKDRTATASAATASASSAASSTPALSALPPAPSFPSDPNGTPPSTSPTPSASASLPSPMYLPTGSAGPFSD